MAAVVPSAGTPNRSGFDCSQNMRHINKDTLLFWIAVTGLTVVAVMAFGPEKKAPYVPLGGRQYEVLSAEFRTGTNIMFDSESAILPWGRRQMDKLGVHLKGPRSSRNSAFAPGRRMYVIAILCKGNGRTVSLSPDSHRFKASQANGRTIELKGRSFTFYSPDRFYLYWAYEEEEFAKLIGYPSLDSTNFVPTELSVCQRSDGREVAEIKLKH
jgi:hypothetical protein